MLSIDKDGLPVVTGDADVSDSRPSEHWELVEAVKALVESVRDLGVRVAKLEKPPA